MEFEWDEGKRARIVAERALDFASAYLFFDGRPATSPAAAARRRRPMEDDSGFRRKLVHLGLVLAWRRHSRDYNEASP